MQLCNERFRIRCFLTKNDPEWHALCSCRIDCSVPLRERFNNQLQLIAERGPNKSSVVFLVASLVFRSEALSSGYSIASSNSVRVLIFGRRIHWVTIPFPGSAHVAAGPLNPPALGRRRVGSCTGNGIGLSRERSFTGAGG